MAVTGIDHLVLYATDVEATCEFYAETLDVADREEFGDGRVALAFESAKLNVHPAGDEYDPHAESPESGSADFCPVVDRAGPALVHDADDVDRRADGQRERAGVTRRALGPLAPVGRYRDAVEHGRVLPTTTRRV
uniref:VOC family protein n=1 Tax=Halorussus rarus TaxID=660515 RepID=UPI00187881CC|nr:MULTISPECIES: VOC family protein [Halorussus]